VRQFIERKTPSLGEFYFQIHGFKLNIDEFGLQDCEFKTSMAYLSGFVLAMVKKGGKPLSPL